MKAVRILSIRKNTDPHIAALEAEYLKRLRPFCAAELVDIRSTYADGLPVVQVLDRERELFEKKIPERSCLIALHETGKAYSSLEFSDWFGRKMSGPDAGLTFVIGGAYGLADGLLRASKETISLSRMTFTHEFARLILLEQLYRSAQIARGTGYHK